MRKTRNEIYVQKGLPVYLDLQEIRDRLRLWLRRDDDRHNIFCVLSLCKPTKVSQKLKLVISVKYSNHRT